MTEIDQGTIGDQEIILIEDDLGIEIEERDILHIQRGIDQDLKEMKGNQDMIEMKGNQDTTEMKGEEFVNNRHN